MKEKFDSGLYRRSLGHFGYMIYDEYIAYRESNEQYREEAIKLRCDEELLVKVFYKHLITKGLVVDKTRNYRTDDDKAIFYRAFLDYCNAIIAIYIIKGKLEGAEKKIERLNSCIEYLAETYENKKYFFVMG